MKYLRSIVCWLLLAALCCGAALADGTGSSAQIQKVFEDLWNDGYYYKIFRGEGISFAEIREKNHPSVAPLLVLLHGAQSNKTGVTTAAKLYADMGYVVVAPDLAGHGDCVTDTPMAIYDIISQSAKIVEQIVSYYADVDYVDRERFGVGGVSLGAMTALYYAATSEQRPQCVLSLLGTPDFGSMVEGGSIYSIRINGASTPITTRKELILIGYPMIVNSPDQHMEELLRVPLMMVNGGADAFIPVEGVKAFAEKAEASYPGKLTLIIYEETGHELSSEQYGSPEVKEFLQKNLPIEGTKR